MTEQDVVIGVCLALLLLIGAHVLLAVVEYLAGPPSRDYRGDKHW